MKLLLKWIWVPVLLALTIQFTFLGGYIDGQPVLEFDPFVFSVCLFVALGHFYVTHYLTAKFFEIYNPAREIYWRSASLSYLPVIAGFWAGFFLDEPSDSGMDLGIIPCILLGLIVGGILFAILCLKKVKMDLDLVLGILFLSTFLGAATIVVFSWLIMQIY